MCIVDLFSSGLTGTGDIAIDAKTRCPAAGELFGDNGDGYEHDDDDHDKDARCKWQVW